MLRTQFNFRVQLAIGAVAVVAGIWVRLERWEWGLLTITIGLVLGLEAINTAIEGAVALASPNVDPRAKVAKDAAAAGVLIAATASVAVGVIVFGARLFP